MHHQIKVNQVLSLALYRDHNSYMRSTKNLAVIAAQPYPLSQATIYRLHIITEDKLAEMGVAKTDDNAFWLHPTT